MGFSVLFSNIAKFGLYGIGIAWVVTPIVILFMWWLGTKAAIYHFLKKLF